MHDVGGYIDCPPKFTEFGLKSLRTRRVMQAGNVITVEPGCYFIKSILAEAFENPEKSKYLNKNKI